MSIYRYTDNEQQINKVLKAHQDDLDMITSTLNTMRRSGEERISESEELLRSLGYAPTRSEIKQTVSKVQTTIPVTENWEEIAQQAQERYPDEVELEDLLTQDEFQKAYHDIDRINKEFQRTTKLTGVDAGLVVIAGALQTLRWALMPEIGQTIDKANRLTDKEGDEIVKDLKKKYIEKHKDWTAKKKHQGKKMRQAEGKTWKEIVFSGVPYDAIKGSKDLGLGLSGNTHRYKTLGHDPILGWVFGTSNILTDTLTLNNLISYRVQCGKLTGESVLPPQFFIETAGRIEDDYHNLPAAVFRQALHYKSDMNTIKGLPIPLLGAFNETLAGQLYTSQYDFLCFARDSKIEGISAVLSVLINMIIGLIHGLYYNEIRDGERDLYDLRTRKILLYSNSLASAGNIAATAFTKNMKMLDVGGLLVTVSRLYSDTRFIARAKEIYLQGKLDAGLQAIISDANEMLYVF